jgi:hypothetical protein
MFDYTLLGNHNMDDEIHPFLDGGLWFSQTKCYTCIHVSKDYHIV